MDRFTILIVDDNKENLFSLRLLLEDSFEDIDILEALSVKDAIKEIMKNKVDLILTDVQMPEINGFDFARYLKDIEETQDIPIIMITGIYEDDFHKKLAYNSSKNVLDFITKPIDEEILCSKLKAFINVFESVRKNKIELEEKAIEINKNKKTIAMLEKLKKHFDDKIEIDKEKIDNFLNSEDDYINLEELFA